MTERVLEAIKKHWILSPFLSPCSAHAHYMTNGDKMMNIGRIAWNLKIRMVRTDMDSFLRVDTRKCPKNFCCNFAGAISHFLTLVAF